jgi:hypothetical protein
MIRHSVIGKCVDTFKPVFPNIWGYYLYRVGKFGDSRKNIHTYLEENLGTDPPNPFESFSVGVRFVYMYCDFDLFCQKEAFQTRNGILRHIYKICL